MTTTYDDLPPRLKSQRTINKTERLVQYEQQKQHQHHHHHHHHHNHEQPQQQQQPQQPQQQQQQSMDALTNATMATNGDQGVIQQNIYPGLNDISDAFELFPQELVRYFTLLKEIDAKCVYTIPYLKLYIKKFLVMDVKHPKRQLLLFKIRTLIKELMPSLEEKMHVASILVDTVLKNVSRIQNDYQQIVALEIDKTVMEGVARHPAIVDTLANANSKSVPSQRSESRREALLAKKALNINAPVSNFENTEEESSSNKRKKPAIISSSSSSRKRKPPVEDNSRPQTPVTTIVLTNTAVPLPSVQLVKSKKPVSKPVQVSVTAAASDDRDNFQEPVYCYCQQVSFGEMVGCDGDDCKREWFHLPCIGLDDPPKGKWYCNDCLSKLKRAKR